MTGCLKRSYSENSSTFQVQELWKKTGRHISSILNLNRTVVLRHNIYDIPNDPLPNIFPLDRSQIEVQMRYKMSNTRSPAVSAGRDLNTEVAALMTNLRHRPFNAKSSISTLSSPHMSDLSTLSLKVMSATIQIKIIFGILYPRSPFHRSQRPSVRFETYISG